MDNPFQLPEKDYELFEHHEIQISEKKLKKKEVQYNPIWDKHKSVHVDRAGKIKDLNRDLDESDLLAIQPLSLEGIEQADVREMSMVEYGAHAAPILEFPDVKETVREYLDRKREILIVKMDIQNKKDETARLDEFIQMEEESLKNNERMFNKNVEKFDKYVEELEKKAKETAKSTELKAQSRQAKQLEINKLIENIERLQSEIEKHEERKSQLEKYRDFVEQLFPSQVRKPSMEHDDLTFITGESKLPARINKTAEQLLDKINTYEAENLFLITQTQEAESEYESMIQQNLQEEAEIMKKVNTVEENVSRVVRTEQNMKLKLENMRKIDDEENMISPRSLAQIKKQLEDIYRELEPDMSSKPSLISMVTDIELEMEMLLKKRDFMDKKEVENFEKKKTRQHKKDRMEENNAEQQRLVAEKRRLIEVRNQKVLKKNTKPVMTRMPPPKKKIKQKKVEIDQDLLDRIEFLEESSLNPLAGAKN